MVLRFGITCLKIKAFPFAGICKNHGTITDMAKLSRVHVFRFSKVILKWFDATMVFHFRTVIESIIGLY